MGTSGQKRHSWQELRELRLKSFTGTLSESEAKISLDYYKVASNDNEADLDSSVNIDLNIEVVRPHNKHDEPNEYYEELFERMKPLLNEIYYRHFMWSEDLQPRSDRINMLEFSGFIHNLNNSSVGASSTPKKRNFAEQQMSLMSNGEMSNNLSISFTNAGKDQLEGEDGDCAQNLSSNHCISSNTTTNNTDHNAKSNEVVAEVEYIESNQKITNENKNSSFDQLLDIEADSNPIKSKIFRVSRVSSITETKSNSTCDQNNSTEARTCLDYYEVASNNNDADSDSSVDVELTIEVVRPHNNHDGPNEYYEVASNGNDTDSNSSLDVELTTEVVRPHNKHDKSNEYYEVASNDNGADSDSSVDVELTTEVVRPHDEPNEYYEELFESMKPLLKKNFYKHYTWSEDLQPRSDYVSTLEFSGFIDNLNNRTFGASSNPKKTNVVEQQMSLISNGEMSNNLSISSTNAGIHELEDEDSDCARNLLSNHCISSNITTNNTDHNRKSNKDVAEVKDTDSNQNITNENKISSFDRLMDTEIDSNPITSNSFRVSRVSTITDRDTNSTCENNNSNKNEKSPFHILMDIEESSNVIKSNSLKISCDHTITNKDIKSTGDSTKCKKDLISNIYKEHNLITSKNEDSDNGQNVLKQPNKRKKSSIHTKIEKSKKRKELSDFLKQPFVIGSPKIYYCSPVK